MKKFVIAAAIVLIFAAYAVYQHNQNNKTQVAQIGTVNQTPASDTPPSLTGSSGSTATSSNSSGSESINPSTPTTPTTPSTPTTSTGQYKDGDYTGTVADAFYGQVQVEATVSGGKITSIGLIQYPSDRGETTQISNRSLPTLKSEAIAAQGANINVVSGATQTSQAFIQSLQSALGQAKA